MNVMDRCKYNFLDRRNNYQDFHGMSTYLSFINLHIHVLYALYESWTTCFLEGKVLM